jgi:hypothetical protein
MGGEQMRRVSIQLEDKLTRRPNLEQINEKGFMQPKNKTKRVEVRLLMKV